MLMEEENVCSSPPDVTVSAVQQPQQALCTSIDHRRSNGEEEAIVWGTIAVQIDRAQGADQLSLEAEAGTREEAGPGTAEEAGLETPEEAGPGTAEEAGLETQNEAGLETPEEAGQEIHKEAGLETHEEAGQKTPEVAGPVTHEEVGRKTPEVPGPETPEVGGPETHEEAGPETHEVGGRKTPEVGGQETHEEAGRKTPKVAGPETPKVAGPETPKVAGPETPEVAGPETPEEAGPETQEEAGPETQEEAAQWGQTVWQLTCTGAPLSFATVQWDVPDPPAATSLHVTDMGSANEPTPGGVTSLDGTSPSLHRSQGVNADLFIRQGRGEDGGFDYLALNSNPELRGNASEPCDAADVQEPPTQEREDPTHELLESNNGIPPTAVLEEEGVPSASSRPVTVDLLDILDVADVSEDEGDSFVDLKPQEEPEQPCLLLTGLRDSEDQQTSANGVEEEEEEDEGEEQEQINVSGTEESEEAEVTICLSYVEFSGDLPRTDDAAATVNPDKPTDRPPSELLEERPEGSHEAPAGQAAEPEMCLDVDQNADPERSEAAANAEEPSAQAAGLTERRETPQRAMEPTEGPEEERGDQAKDFPPRAEPERLEAAEEPRGAGVSQHLDPPPEEPARSRAADPPGAPVETGESQTTPHLSPEPADGAGGGEEGSASEERAEPPGGAPPPLVNGDAVNGEMARRLAERLRGLDGIQRVDVVKHIDKDNDFSRAVGEEYLKLFDFTGQTLDHALRCFLKVVVLIGETQERERVLQHFACRFHHCNPDSFTSSESVLALTCAVMLLNTDLHGQNVGKSMSSTKFVSNLDGMDEGENFSKDLLKSLYNSIKSEPLQWAVDEEELKSSVLVDEDAAEDAPLRSKFNPFQDVPHDKTASVVKQGFLQRKLHADIDGKRTPWGKRGWKTFYGVVRGMVLYLQKDDYRREQPIDEEVVSLHHSLAEQAADYTKKPYVFRLQTADWRVLLFQASSKLEMHSWISRVNLVSALHSSPPFPAAVGSQRRFCRPILPSSQSAHTPERQLQSYAETLQSFKEDLSYLQQNLPEGKRAKAKELEEHRVRAEYLHHEMCRYEIYIQGLEAWKSVTKAVGGALSVADLNQFDKAVCAYSAEEEEVENEGRLKKSHSSPSLELEIVPPALIKVRRNISERRTYRRTIIPRWNKEV
ncbi:PH and SEC7 domain-containing protein 4 isoform X2 [Pungitius pungitius]|uniref:PH and SEC7 domain-containing protein 4 isoform X2 n=1 Tax=Pungitius pungitius TaxID=134920 RepID=UPI002E14D792